MNTAVVLLEGDVCGDICSDVVSFVRNDRTGDVAKVRNQSISLKSVPMTFSLLL